MKRATFVALGTGLAITSAAALDIAGAGGPAHPAAGADATQAWRVRAAARAEQRSRIEARYAAQRAGCASVKGKAREGCIVAAHAARGRAMLEAAAPYERRF